MLRKYTAIVEVWIDDDLTDQEHLKGIIQKTLDSGKSEAASSVELAEQGESYDQDADTVVACVFNVVAVEAMD